MFNEERSEFLKWSAIIGMVLLGAMITLSVIHFATKPARLIDKVTEPDHIIYNYEEFQNSYEAILEMCDQISMLEELEEGSSGGFSKSERILAMKQKLRNEIANYNSRSEQITKSMWKNPDLPQTIKFEEVCVQ